MLCYQHNILLFIIYYFRIKPKRRNLKLVTSNIFYTVVRSIMQSIVHILQFYSLEAVLMSIV